jgi:S1/P1 Nuclease
MLRWLPLAAAVGVLTFPPAPARAWNDAGHKTVALLAFRDLPESTRLQVIKVLQGHPHFDCFLNADRPEDVNRNEWIVVRAATWPDFVRPPYAHKPCTDNPAKHPKNYHHPEWHFIDGPFVPPEQKSDLDRKQLQPTPPHAVSVLEKAVADLKGGGLDAEGQAVTLCWVLHLIGDVHQPLHAAKLFADQFPPPEGDRGGNFFFVPNRRHAPNLHHYWDSLLGEDSGFASVDLVVERIRHTPRYSREHFQQELQHKQFKDWADESYAAAVKYAYRRGRLKGLNTQEHQPGEHVPALSETYEGDALEVAFRRGALAGMRLRDRLQELFGK